MKILHFFVGIILLCNFDLNNANANKPIHIADYKFWSVHKTAEGIKYMVSYPIEDAGDFAKREEPYFMISNFDGNPESSVYVGYYYKKNSEPKINIYLSAKDPKKVETYTFYTKNNMAWIKDTSKEATFIEKLKLGDKMIVISESTKNTGAKDTYSLEGFQDAYKEIMKK